MKPIFFLLASCLMIAGCSSGGDGSGGGGQGATGGGGATASGGAGGGGGDTASTGGGGAGQGGTTGTGGAQPEPTVKMAVDPTMMQAGDTVTATVDVTHFILEAPVGQPNQAGHGHYHIYLDDAAGGGYLIADQVHSVKVQIPAGTNVGKHTLKVSLGENDHAPLSPAVEDVVDITVVAP